MIKINLLPYHLRPIKRSPLPYIVAFAVLAITVLCIVGIEISSLAQISKTKATLAAHQKELDGLKEIVDEYNRLTDQKLLLADKISIINEIVSDRIIWSRQLWNINRLTPENFWYTSIVEKEKSFKTTRLVYNEKAKKEERKPITIKRRVLILAGYAIEGPDGNNDTYPLTFNTEQDPEFAALFQLDLPKIRDTEFQGFKVRWFSLEYKIAQGGKG